MSGQMLRILAVVFALGAVLVGWFGYRISQQEPAPQQPVSSVPGESQEQPEVRVVVVKEPLPRGAPIRADEVELASVPIAPDGAFDDPSEVIGRVPLTPVAPGSVLLQSHFQGGSALSRNLRPGERAVAIQVDEVVGGGGFINPGDFVDVVGYFRRTNSETDTTTAQTVLRRVRVIAYGDEITRPSQPGRLARVSAGDEDASADAIEMQRREDSARLKGRSAVLAVPKEDVSRLMLADSAGDLRLAVYGAAELGESSLAGSQGAGQSTGSAGREADRVSLGELVNPPKPKKKSVYTGARVTVFKGSDAKTVYTR